MSANYLWRKSSYSSGEGECVEVALPWTKSSHSGDQGGECVEVAHTPATIHVRDSKNPEGPALRVAPSAWTEFLTHATTP
ncbi:DUF397 domain-containing protein [Streptomyces alfalfae]|uniref:DUF397 domain-containing protein n=1 Tax=Streptomyces alfalfae TaxID=1642299 RepID=UPI00097580B8|nr:DUF397 domain-containing protein [Streptomyces alfalfae]AYA18098.1 DUF397 domain-containing protein [Streptomyces fradiae]RXX40216.1 DUF397 domain-containing protein [Streptomyces alfalfae]RZM87534.1 DUF397 domain-containing protein [Streptomyces alfalfae]